MDISARLIAVTQPVIDLSEPTPEGIVAHCARVSSGRDYDKRSEDYQGLLNYCIRNKHWSIFQMVNAVVEINAPRDITRQLVRHSSMVHLDPSDYGIDYTAGGVQEFSQRYSDDIQFIEREVRQQDNKNRQNSIDGYDTKEKEYLRSQIEWVKSAAKQVYGLFRSKEWDVAKECSRVVLPEGLVMSQVYSNATLRSWLTYLEVRDDPGVTQWEHVLVAREIRKVLAPVFPTVIKQEK